MKLPISIDPKTDPNWTYKSNVQFVDYSQKEVAVGIKPNPSNLNAYVVGEYKPVWQITEGGGSFPTERIVNSDFGVGQEVKAEKSRWRLLWWLLIGGIGLLFLLR